MTNNTRLGNEADAVPSKKIPPAKDADQAPNPESIPDVLPDVDPQQTPGIDHPPAEKNPHDREHKHSP